MDFRLLANQMLSDNNITVIKEVNGSYGRALNNSRNIIVPKHLGYLGFAIFCHEVGHIVLGHCNMKDKKYRCLKEYEAWQYTKDTFKKLGVPFKSRVAKRMKRSLSYAKSKALNRGMLQTNLPKELKKY